ncbi:uncharacterized protein Dwil_GK10229 [Drosophila willistoni]|uniref:DUF4773 domain-containing protein n=1 Tax=Drosophila willistoni TaxID=7260 RepID=B4NDF6_DROWI|nr:uncharacterized protein LOC6648671 [Drosophila willistoni]EDW82862.1 uncharacterized protein Dwil_GK10229 [Drosophila willistoni]
MRNFKFVILLVLVACASLTQVGAKTVFRRTDKISENFKQLDLPPEEIDPNVAPPEAQPIKGDVDETDAESTDDTVAGINAINETLNEIPNENAASAVTTLAPPKATPAATTAAVAAKPTAKPEDDKNPIGRYCKCSESHCDCCRKFGLPLLPSGPGCAKISYLGNDEMSVSLKYGDITLASRRISAKKARPICVGLPGGYSQFCGRVYGLSRAKENFKACLAFELRADEEVEASLRVSCFKFGPEGLKVAEAEPLPVNVNKDDDDDDDDLFGFAAGGDDDEDEEEDDYDDADDDNETEDYAEESEDDDAEAPEDADYGGFSLGGLLDELDDDEDEKPPKKKATATTDAAVAPADQTREHVESMVQSKDEVGSVPAEATEAAIAADKEKDKEELEQVTVAPVDSTTAKAKKSKKAKKNKKKKAANVSSSESGFAYELLNGILDFFN